MKFLLSHKWVAIFSLQVITVIILYVLLPGHADIKRTAFQPDSINSVCMGLEMGHSNLDKTSKVESSISKYFGAKLQCPDSITPPYRTRLLLPALIALFSKVNLWWAVFIPSVIIYFLFGYIYYKLTKNFNLRQKYSFLVLLSPFLSIHLGWFFANIMTEGPVALFLTGLAFFWLRGEEFSNNFVSLASLGLGIGAIYSKQVWPIVAVTWIIIISQRDFSKKYKYIFGTVAFFVAYAINYSTQLVGTRMYGSDFGAWNQWSIFQQPGKAVNGIFLGIRHDLLAPFMFFDIPFFLILFFLYLLFKSNKVAGSVKILIAVYITWSTATLAEVYLADGSYGQNWRFFSFSLIPIVPVVLRHGVDY